MTRNSSYNIDLSTDDEDEFFDAYASPRPSMCTIPSFNANAPFNSTQELNGICEKDAVAATSKSLGEELHSQESNRSLPHSTDESDDIDYNSLNDDDAKIGETVQSKGDHFPRSPLGDFFAQKQSSLGSRTRLSVDTLTICAESQCSLDVLSQAKLHKEDEEENEESIPSSSSSSVSTASNDEISGERNNNQDETSVYTNILDPSARSSIPPIASSPQMQVYDTAATPVTSPTNQVQTPHDLNNKLLSPVSPEAIYRIVDRETGKVQDIREMKNTFNTQTDKYTIVPSTHDLNSIRHESSKSLSTESSVSTDEGDENEDKMKSLEKSVSNSRATKINDDDITTTSTQATPIIRNTMKLPGAIIGLSGQKIKNFRMRFAKKDHANATPNNNDTVTENGSHHTHSTTISIEKKNPAAAAATALRIPARKKVVSQIPGNRVPVKTFGGGGQVLHQSQHQSQHNESHDNSMLLLDVRMNAHKGAIWSMEFSPDSKYLATTGDDKKIMVWKILPEFDGDEGNDDATHVNANIDENEYNRFATKSDEDAVGNRSESKVGDIPPQLVNKGGGPIIGAEVKFLSQFPIQTFDEHAEPIVDIAWSSNENPHFLLSASLDKTVRLWHITRSDPYHIFQHADLVTSVQFHPKNDSLFLSGSVDKKLRVWSIPDGRVKEWAQAPDYITAARYTPNGLSVCCGMYHGQVYLYSCSTDGLRYHTQIACKNRRGSDKDGRKVTGISFLSVMKSSPLSLQQQQKLKQQTPIDASSISTTNSSQSGMNKAATPSSSSSRFNYSNKDKPSNNSNNSNNERLKNNKEKQKQQQHDTIDNIAISARKKSPSNLNDLIDKNLGSVMALQMLVTTNDSRIRLFALDDYSLICKYKGATNSSMQIAAVFSESGDKIVSGSDVGNVYTWSTRKEGQEKNHSLSVKATAHNQFERCKTYEMFKGSCIGGEAFINQNNNRMIGNHNNTDGDIPIVTHTQFAPGETLKKALLQSGLFPTLMPVGLDHVKYDMSSAMVVASDYDGNIRVFLQKSCFDLVKFEAGPEGSYFAM
eukprot:CAMPEP_0194363800 /NCGR_PEP_ID=MMETSP0174-20130528/11653_1 /TAXON_ID=216777 /ORGANISM="Proboscia alata, Strain PI-D3" /LENGTH=1043 /DNA_ID=CAMNT_0039137453 /DNA_START=45 /DNA_END=3179 /DNA_ORIENTATION=+